MSDTASWASIHFHYLVTSRNDIRAGSFTFDSPELLTPPTSNESRSIQLNHFFGAVRRWSARSNYVIVYTYLAGVTSEDRFLDLRIGSSSVNLPQSTISLTLTISNQDSPIENIYVSFVMYTDMNSPVDITIINSMINAVQTSFNANSSINTYIGINRISALALSQLFTPSSGRLLATVLNRQNLQNFIGSFQLHGFTLTAKQFFQGPILTESALSGSTPNTTSGCANYTECQRLGGVFLTVDNQKQCIVCRTNSQWNPITRSCQCSNNFFRAPNGNCLSLDQLCGNNQIFMNGSCYQISTGASSRCNPNQFFNVSSQQCQCRTNFIAYVKNGTLKCAAPCTNQLTFNWQSQQCECVSSFFDSNEMCINCGDDLATYNQNQSRCQCVEGTFALLGGKCQRCSRNAVYNPQLKRCECETGYSGNGILCRRNNTNNNNATGFTIFFVNANNSGNN